MKTETFYLVCKDRFMTRFLQDADMFESFKFCGRMQKATGVFEKPLPEVVHNFNSKSADDDNYEVVGIIVPGRGSFFLPNHTVMSENGKWCMVEDMCNAYKAPLETVNA